jgi:hypothetical protein
MMIKAVLSQKVKESLKRASSSVTEWSGDV